MGTDPTAGIAARSLPGFAAPVIERCARVRQRLLRVDRAHPWIFDAAVTAVVFLLFGGPDLWRPAHSGGPHDPQVVLTQLPAPVSLLLQAGLLLPLLWRRRAPTLAFGVMAAVFLVQWLLGAGLRADAALLIALYSVALRARPDRVLWACVAAAAVMVPLSFRVASGALRWEVLFFLLSAVTAAVALGLVVRSRRAQLVALRERAAQLEVERDQRSRLAAATERTRVAREMHDIIGHNLSVIITVADGGAYAAETDPARGREALLLIGDAGRQALGELRRMLGVLRERGTEHAEAPELEPQPGIADLETLFARVRAAGTEVVYHSGGALDGLDRGMQLMAYRIVQEALTNTLKHVGPGSRADVTVGADAGQLRIRVRDNGRRDGSTVSASPGEGHGLAGMRERAALYGGTVTAGPTSGGGWDVEAILDLTDNPPLPNSAGGQP
ncbi:sensor histidine kinase [Nocardia jiangxiensis]|uniref:sensor histidine kinase n=1 Tax=Nocardia jiangxiensis TaxID=282685 RepID=UPI0005940EC2|nr:sensor histidine kinase [Nocardia jiangxiensis]